MSTSALSPANAPIVRGTAAMMQYMHQRGLTLQHGLILLHIMGRDDQTLFDYQIEDILFEAPGEAFGSRKRKDRLATRLRAHQCMSELEKLEIVTFHIRHDEPEWITLTEAGAVDLMAMLGACMLSGADDRA